MLNGFRQTMSVSGLSNKKACELCLTQLSFEYEDTTVYDMCVCDATSKASDHISRTAHFHIGSLTAMRFN